MRRRGSWPGPRWPHPDRGIRAHLAPRLFFTSPPLSGLKEKGKKKKKKKKKGKVKKGRHDQPFVTATSPRRQDQRKRGKKKKEGAERVGWGENADLSTGGQ